MQLFVIDCYRTVRWMSGVSDDHGRSSIFAIGMSSIADYDQKKPQIENESKRNIQNKLPEIRIFVTSFALAD